MVEAVERRDLDELKGEIGDLVFEGVFLSQLCAETGDFTITDALNDVRAKLVRRHPHVFAPDAGTADVTTPRGGADAVGRDQGGRAGREGPRADQRHRRRPRRPAGAAARLADFRQGRQGRLRMADGRGGAREGRRGDGGGPRRARQRRSRRTSPRRSATCCSRSRTSPASSITIPRRSSAPPPASSRRASGRWRRGWPRPARPSAPTPPPSM